MSRHTTRRRFLHGGVAVGGIALAGCVGGEPGPDAVASAGEEADDEDDGDHEDDEREADDEGSDAEYEVWAFDQGTDTGYIYGPDGEDSFELLDEIDVAGLAETESGGNVPHMVDFSSDYEYAAVACTAGAATLVFRTEDRELVGACPTGPGTHFAGFTPDDEYIQVDVIGEGSIKRIDADLENEEFSIVDEIHVVEAGPVADRIDEFDLDDEGELRPICHDYSNGTSYHTLGPGIDNAGVVIVDYDSFEVVEAFAPGEVRANCGTMAHPSENKLYLTAGAPSNHEPTGGVGEWYVIDTEEHRPIDPETDEVVEGEYSHEDVSRDSGGYDAHGFWFTADESEFWILNRETDDGLVIDPGTDEVIEEVPDYGPAPDIMWGSPDGRYKFVTLRGPNPLSGDPHAATGETPGFSVIDVESRAISEVVQPDDGNPDSDFHGIGVRVIEG
ncbi:YncE family protein [Natronorarus salvus]|uniref:YncE family protein n=1 Tax=Natronorarus salvus TaxID=3117733 RepID=UPI002F25FEBF